MLTVHVAEVRTLLLAAVACEIFGFSYQTAMPVFARDVLGAGAEGLGTLNAAASIGGAVAVVLLALVPGRVPRQPVLALVFIVYGVGLLVLAPSPTLALAAAALVIVGACAASFDVLQQTLMQLAVPESQRGRAVGLWVLGIGSAPIGNLEMGALVAGLGAPLALVINGALVVVAAMVLVVTAPAYRQTLIHLRHAVR
jgi:MFS family permease